MSIGDFAWPVYMAQLIGPGATDVTPEEVETGLVARDQAVEDFLGEVALTADRGVANGYASLDANGLVPTAELATGAVASGQAPVYNGTNCVWVDIATQTELDNHVNDTTAAHAASAISADSTTLVGVATDVQGVLEELDNSIADHLADTTAAHAASAISYAGGTGMSATDVEAAIDELADEKQNLTRAVNAQTGATYTFVLGDAGNVVTLSNAGAVAVTVPTNASVAFPVGTVLTLILLSATASTLAGAGGVTVNGSAGLAQYERLELVQVAANTWNSNRMVAT